MKYLTIVLISIFSLQLQSQITQIGDNTYSYDGIRYTDKGLGPLLQSNRVAHSHYQKWLKSSNRGVGYALSGLGMTILGSSMISNTKNDVVYFLSGAPILGLGLVTAGVVVGSIGLLNYRKVKMTPYFMTHCTYLIIQIPALILTNLLKKYLSNLDIFRDVLVYLLRFKVAKNKKSLSHGVST